MIDTLAAAAAAAEAPTNSFSYTDGGPDFSLFVWVGMITLFVVCPFAAGLIHARQWRKLLVWIIILGSASVVLLTGQVLLEEQLNRLQPDIPQALLIATMLTLVPSLVAASVGILLRRPWALPKAKVAGPETFK